MDSKIEVTDWRKELTALLDENEVKPDGFALYLNFMYRYNMDSDGVVDGDVPYRDDKEDISGVESQTRFLVENIASTYGAEVQYATIRDQETSLDAGYHYGLFYLGEDLIDKFATLRDELEINLNKFLELGRIPVMPQMQFTLLSKTPPEGLSDEIDEEDKELF